MNIPESLFKLAYNSQGISVLVLRYVKQAMWNEVVERIRQDEKQKHGGGPLPPPYNLSYESYHNRCSYLQANPEEDVLFD